MIKDTGALRILVVGPVYGGSLPVATYCAFTLRKMGHHVEFIDNSRFNDALFYARDAAGDQSEYSRLAEQLSAFLSGAVLCRARQFRPDIVLSLAQAPLTEKCLGQLNSSGVVTAMWFVEDFRVMTYWKETAPLYRRFFTIQKGDLFDEMEKAGLTNYHYLPMAACPDIHRPLELSAEETLYYGSDLSFVGAGYYNRQHFFRGLLDFDLKIWGTEWDRRSVLGARVQRAGSRVDTEESVKIFNASKININLHSSTYHRGINPFGDFVNPRTFEILSCEAFQIVDSRSCLRELFSPGEDIVVFENLDDLRQKVRWYLDHPEEMKRMARRGRERLLQEHTYEHRMKEIIDIVRRDIPDRGSHHSSEHDAEQLIADAAGCSELRQLLSGFRPGDKVTLRDLAEAVREGEGEISRAEKIILIMDEFTR